MNLLEELKCWNKPPGARIIRQKSKSKVQLITWLCNYMDMPTVHVCQMKGDNESYQGKVTSPLQDLTEAAGFGTNPVSEFKKPFYVGVGESL